MKIYKSLYLNHVGLLELILALFPILSGYYYGPIYFDFFIPLIMIIVARLKKVPFYNNKPLKYLAYYLCFHEFFLIIFADVGLTPITNMIGDVTHILVICFIIRWVDYKKFIGSIMWVAIICSIGLVFHYILISQGQFVTPIKLPLLPDPGIHTRLHEIGYRPVSFFWEPAHYASFMIIPFTITLFERKFLVTIIILLLIAISTSTSGIVSSIIIMISWIFLSKISLKFKLFFVVASLFLLMYTYKGHYLDDTISKIETTDLEETARTINGPVLFENMDINDIICGLPDNTPNDYYKKGKIKDYRLVVSDELYLSSFWYIIAKLGLMGLILYMCVIYDAVKNNYKMLPFIASFIVSMFASCIYVSSTFTLYFIFIYLNKIHNNTYHG